MNLWLITPAWGRFEVSRLVFEQRARLVSELAPRGIAVDCVVIADDENLEIARSHGFETIEMGNQSVGRKVNAGFEFAASQGADFLAFVGSDDWLHEDLFRPLLDSDDCRNEVVSGKEMTLVDLSRGVLTTMRVRSLNGVIPWLIPTGFLAHCGYRPIEEHLSRGLDYSLFRQIRRRPWVFHDPHPHTRVDFKSDTNITPWSQIGRAVGNSPEVPIDRLRDYYPAQLVALAEEFSWRHTSIQKT